MLQGEPGITVCGEASSPDTALATVNDTKPDVATVDLLIGEEKDAGFTLISSLAKVNPSVRVLVVSGYDGNAHADRARGCGALGYVLKDNVARELIPAVRRVAAGQVYAKTTT